MIDVDQEFQNDFDEEEQRKEYNHNHLIFHNQMNVQQQLDDNLDLDFSRKDEDVSFSF